MNIPAKTLFFSMLSLLTLSACGNNGGNSGAVHQPDAMVEPLAPDGWADAAGRFVSNTDASVGFIVLAESPSGGVVMRVDLKGLSQGWHGIHLHQVADCSDYAAGFKASGGHIDPDDRAHGLFNTDGYERADMPNIYAGSDGRATVEIFNASVALFPSEAASAADAHPLIDDDGFAVIIHENADDHETQPIGGAAARVACAAIRSGL